MCLAACNRQARSTPETLYQDARLQFERGEFAECIAASDSALKRFESSEPDWAWRFRILKAEALVWRGESQNAAKLISTHLPASLASDDVAVRRLDTLGLAETFMQHFDQAQSYFDKAIALAGDRAPLLSEAYSAQGTMWILRNDYPAASERSQRALDLARQSRRPFLEANALGNLGVVAMRRQHFDEAIDRFGAAIPIAQKIGNQAQTSKLKGNLGWCQFKMGDFENALASFTEAEASSSKLGLLRDQQVWLTNIGLVYNQRRDYQAAIVNFLKALTAARKLQNRSAAAISLTNLAASSLELKRFDEAEAYNREALDLKRAIGDKPSELYSLVNAARIAAGRKKYPEAARLLKDVVSKSGEDVSLRWEAQSELAVLYELQRNYVAADTQFRTALKTIDAARAGLKEEHRLSFMGSAERFYNDYIDFLISRGRTKEALGVAEHSRARTLADGLKIPVAGLLDARFAPEVTSRNLHSVILSYWLKPERSYLWAVTPDRVSLFTLPPGDEIDRAVQEYRKALVGPRDLAANPDAIKLFALLVAPAQSLIKPGAHVVVIGDRALNVLNFETLLLSKPQTHFWIEDAVISNASSIALLGNATSRRQKPQEQVLLVGDPIYKGTEFPELKQAKLELKSVAGHFDSSQRLVLEGASATPAAYATANPDRFGYLHFVAHGTASQTSPLDSSIVLSRYGESYKLYARDIMKQPLRAELVTISACYGAGNRSYSGEGLVGLSWAFLRAGAHNVVAALWEVSDDSTPRLMDDMYAGLKAGREPAAALRDAKLKMLHSDSIYRKPFYWGAFQVYSGY